MPAYTIRKGSVDPLEPDWEQPAWSAADTLTVGNFRPESSTHRPQVQVRMVYDREAIYGIFRVADRYIRCLYTDYGSPVCRDSCVEFFVQPRGTGGYFNFEMNAGGAMLLNYITDHRRVPGGFAAARAVKPEDAAAVERAGTLSAPIDPELPGPCTWLLAFRIPVSLLKSYDGDPGNLPGAQWRGNFFKCGDDTSHPHWASWSPVDELNFHLPRCFGVLRFED